MREAGTECLLFLHFEGFEFQAIVKLLPQDSFCSSRVGMAGSLFSQFTMLVCTSKDGTEMKDLYNDHYTRIECNLLLAAAI